MSTGTNSPAAASGLRPGWNRAQPERLPEPTAWPVALALAVAFILWGLVSTLMITAVGLAVFATALAGWIRDILHEREHQ